MIIFKDGQLTKKEKVVINSIYTEISDIYGDFYITQNNLRLYLKENIHILYKALEKGDKVIFGEEGIIFITGWSDKSDRKYVKILAKDSDNADKLIKVLNWNLQQELYIKIKKNNPIKVALQRNGFRFKGDRGAEVLLRREPKELKFNTKQKLLPTKDDRG